MAIKNELLLTLMERIDRSSDASALRDVIVIWLALLGKFSPLIGPTSVQVLFVRSLDVNRADFPWLPAISPGVGDGQHFSAFESVLKTQPSEQVIGVTHALLGSFIDSLFTLIGQTLTAKFVCSAVGNKRDQKSR
jgi:hypothetical protein